MYKTNELNGLSCIKNPSRSSALLNTENIYKYCSSWFILAQLHPCEKSHPTRVKNERHYFIELNIQGFDFTYGFKCSDIHKFDKLNNLSNLSINMFELKFHEDRNKWKHNFIRIEISKIDESEL